jgi:hypothetical protein
LQILKTIKKANNRNRGLLPPFSFSILWIFSSNSSKSVFGFSTSLKLPLKNKATMIARKPNKVANLAKTTTTKSPKSKPSVNS